MGDAKGRIGIVLQGGMYNGVIRALQRLGLADLYGDTKVPLYVLNVTYPLVDDEFLAFCKDKEAVLDRRGGPARLSRAGFRRHAAQGRRQDEACRQGLPADGRRIYRPGHARRRIEILPRACAGISRRDRSRAPNAPPVSYPELAKIVPMRPPGFCTGCPERPIFSAMKLVEKELGPASCRRRYRLPSLLDHAALQYRRDDHGLWSGACFRFGLQCRGRQALDRHHGRWRLLA